MSMPSKTVVAGALAALFATACGTTNIVTNDPRARIYVDGTMIGRGQGELSQRGTPGSSTVLVKTDDGRQETQRIERRFTATTFIAGLFTYGICLFACWEYPQTVFVALAEAPRASGGWGDANDPWMQPPPGWTPPPQAAPAPAPPQAVPAPAPPSATPPRPQAQPASPRAR